MKRIILILFLIGLFIGCNAQQTFKTNVVVLKSTPTITLTGTSPTVSWNGVTIIGSSGLLTISGNLSLGNNNLIGTGSLFSTSSRGTKAWFDDLEITNTPTVSGVTMLRSQDVTDTIGARLTTATSIGSIAVMKHPTVNPQTTSYQLQLVDDGAVVTMNSSSATNLTVPLNSSVAFPIGTQIEVFCLGTGKTTVVATGGVTITSTALGITVKKSAYLIKLATDTWYLTGWLE